MSRVGPFAAVLFDLDGTLLDSVELIVESYRHTLAAHGLPPRERADVLLGLGQTLEDQFRRWYGEDAPIDALVQTYIAHNRDVHDDWVKPFDGLGAVVERLHNAGVPLAVVTSKRGAGARRGLAALGLTERFEVVVAGDDVARPKPDPEPVRLALRQLGDPDPARVVFVGDATHDVAAGRAAGVVTVAVTWGSGTRDALVAAEPTHLVDSVADLDALLSS